MKNLKTDFPADFFDWAHIPSYQDKLAELSNLAEPEDWQYKNHPATNTGFPILDNYLKFTYKRISKEKKIEFDKTDKACCFNSGLVTALQEEIYLEFKENQYDATQYWYFSGFFRKGEHLSNKYARLPDLAYYFDDVSKLVFDHRKPLIINYEHIINDNRTRFPDAYSKMTDYQLVSYLKGVLESTLARVRRNYKIAVPQYYNDSIQLLLPICMEDPKIASLALVVEDFGTNYRAATCLPLDWAMNNARQIAKPDKEWLNP